ncbi:hypothetical protein EV193_102642 [Herbihabitans rhizosphaerae]|uniref:Uncharacterized protein n=1 Tax=Herbihabitans rhizosphaerae TaxID=1872711 RepID=A0A4Q7L561_9PSEU|nr:hypothetical protein [Herbihabitans rhizosphaerae]RZS43661.1 hypothetical protein EV193_102642 [Herbihabitans rhizosphaerae]
MANGRVLWIDRDFDREQDDTGRGRFAAHVEARLDDLHTTLGDISPVPFASAVWRLATPPDLDPGFVRWHRRVLSASCAPSTWDGTLIATVRLASPQPTGLAVSKTWWRDRGWRGWPELFGQFVEPTDRDLAASPHIRTSVLIEAPLPLDGLAVPENPYDSVADKAELSVAALVRSLNDLLVPVVDAMESAVERP